MHLIVLGVSESHFAAPHARGRYSSRLFFRDLIVHTRAVESAGTLGSTSGITSPLRSWYSASITDFLEASPDTVLGQLTANCDFVLIPSQRDAWSAEIEILRSQLKGISGSVLLEFNIPRMGRRVDVVLLIGQVVFALEFKIGEAVFDRSAIDQVWDYALDLKNFHEASHDASIVPILVATEAKEPPPITFHADTDGVYRPVLAVASGLRDVLDSALCAVVGSKLDAQTWARAPYHPTPTIVEAARSVCPALRRSDRPF